MDISKITDSAKVELSKKILEINQFRNEYNNRYFLIGLCTSLYYVLERVELLKLYNKYGSYFQMYRSEGLAWPDYLTFVFPCRLKVFIYVVFFK
uniref:Uncharacterized protein n=1 Tax=Heterorhabditis bacteriophora TaxID=37862 RepID=A0A1I7X7G0_HETBA